MKRVIFIVLLATAAIKYVLAKDLILGGPVPNDHSVRNATVIRKPKPFSHKVVVVLGDGSNITSIQAIDHNVTNNANVSVIIGGLGNPAVILYFESPRNRGLNFTVEVRGVHPPKPTPPPTTIAPPTPPPPPPSTTGPPSPPETTLPESEEEESTEEESYESNFLRELYLLDN